MKNSNWNDSAISTLEARQNVLMAEHTEIEAIKKRLSFFGGSKVNAKKTPAPSNPTNDGKGYTLSNGYRAAIIKSIGSGKRKNKAIYNAMRKQGYKHKYQTFNKYMSRMTQLGLVTRVSMGTYSNPK